MKDFVMALGKYLAQKKVHLLKKMVSMREREHSIQMVPKMAVMMVLKRDSN